MGTELPIPPPPAARQPVPIPAVLVQAATQRPEMLSKPSIHRLGPIPWEAKLPASDLLIVRGMGSQRVRWQQLAHGVGADRMVQCAQGFSQLLPTL